MTEHTPPLDTCCFLCHELRDGQSVEFVSHEHGYAHAACLATEYYRSQAVEPHLRAERDALRQQLATVREAAQEAILQIEYLHQKFQETGSGNQVVARLRVLAAAQEPS